MAKLEGVFLDFYGTVAGGDRQAVEEICQAVIDDHGLEVAARDLAAEWGRAYFAGIESVNGSGFRLLREIEHDTLVETVTPRVGRFEAGRYIDRLNEYLARPSLFEEVRAVLEALPLPVCLVSNADERELEAALDHHGLKFDFVVTSESARSYKPDSGIFREALKRTGWSADRVVHVGDSLHSDVGGARRAGLATAWVCRTDRIGDIGTEKPDLTWNDLRPLISLAHDGFDLRR